MDNKGFSSFRNIGLSTLMLAMLTVGCKTSNHLVNTLQDQTTSEKSQKNEPLSAEDSLLKDKLGKFTGKVVVLGDTIEISEHRYLVSKGEARNNLDSTSHTPDSIQEQK